ncbi:MAG: hypothetical protein E6700_08985 [Winkia neuii]|nr:hypothetical protein [Winkia neuii]MDK8099873.1 hypothetical protein [Winkia neuii]MDU3135690.1 hypothetical protein [Winkia neuii]
MGLRWEGALLLEAAASPKLWRPSLVVNAQALTSPSTVNIFISEQLFR